MPKRVSDRLVRSVAKFQDVLNIAKDRDVNEADTVSITKDILAEVFGYDKYLDVTSEFAIRSTFCDLAIKVDNTVQYLIEVKAIGLALREGHLRQAIEYGANNGVPWVILTNGVSWQVHKIKFEKPVSHDLVCSFSLTDLDPKDEEAQDRLFIICKEGLVKDAREEYHQRILTVNRFVLGSLIVSDEVVNVLRRELRKLSDGVLVSQEEIARVLTNEVLKREVIDGEEASKAQTRVRRFYGKAARRSRQTAEEKSFSASDDPLLAEPPLSDRPTENTQDSGDTSGHN